MSLADREWSAVIHGMVLGAIFLFAFAGGLTEFWSLREGELSEAGIARRTRRLEIGTMVSNFPEPPVDQIIEERHEPADGSRRWDAAWLENAVPLLQRTDAVGSELPGWRRSSRTVPEEPPLQPLGVGHHQADGTLGFQAVSHLRVVNARSPRMIEKAMFLAPSP